MEPSMLSPSLKVAHTASKQANQSTQVSLIAHAPS